MAKRDSRRLSPYIGTNLAKLPITACLSTVTLAGLRTRETDGTVHMVTADWERTRLWRSLVATRLKAVSPTQYRDLRRNYGRGFGIMGKGGGGAETGEKAGCSLPLSDLGKKSGAFPNMIVIRR
jgi:hypothetical protein